MTGIFINYRTGDDSWAVVAVDQALTDEFGSELVFRDHRALKPGVAFPPELWRRLEESTVLVALIGPRWLTIADGGVRRLDNAEDYVRREIKRALDRNIHVFPVLLDQTPLPRKQDLPQSISELVDRQVMTLRQHDAEDDIARLVRELRKHVPSRRRSSAPEHAQESGQTNYWGSAPNGALAQGPNAKAVYRNNVDPTEKAS